MAEKKLSDADTFNLMLALTAILVPGGEHTTASLAKHFDVPESEIKRALETIAYTDTLNMYSNVPYRIDLDDLKEGIVNVVATSKDVIQEVSQLSSRQASTLAAGLVYLASIPGASNVGEIEELQKIIASGIQRGESTIELNITPGTPDADLAVLREAITSELSISCDYLTLKGENKVGRIIEPRLLEIQGEYTYLRGWCPENEDVRSFRIDRMRSARILRDRPISEAAKSAEIPELIYTPSRNDVVVTLEVEPEAYSLIADFKPTEQPIAVNEYVKRFNVKVGDVRNLGRIIARFGGAARVISPNEAKHAVHQFALEAITGKVSKQPKDAE